MDEKGELYVIEVNPRASRTIPFLSKVTGIPMVTLAILAITGHKFKDLGLPTGLMPEGTFTAVKSPVFSFAKMIQVDVGLGPEMKSTGEVMGIAESFPQALKKSMLAAGLKVPTLGQMKSEPGSLLCTVADKDKEEALYLMQRFAELGFKIYSTTGTAAYFARRGLDARPAFKLTEGRPHIIDMLRNGTFQLIINTISDNRTAEIEARAIRRAAVESNIPVLTSLDTANALVTAIVTPLEDEDGLPHVTELHSIPRHFEDVLAGVMVRS
jgi:carbamoyl-phosphate synthase large subunit